MQIMPQTQNPILHIKAWRKARGLTQQDIADAIGRDFSVVSKMENGKVGVTHGNLARIAEALHTSTSSLYLPPPEGTRPIQPGDAAQVGGLRLPGEPPQPFSEPLVFDAPPRQAAKPIPVFDSWDDPKHDDPFFEISPLPHHEIARPESMSPTKGVYALFMQGTAAAPRFEHGDLIFAQMDRRPRRGERVVVRLRRQETRAPGDPVCVARLVGDVLAVKANESLKLERIDNGQIFEIEAERIQRVDRIMSTAEVFDL